jgi:hypothetical protein
MATAMVFFVLTIPCIEPDPNAASRCENQVARPKPTGVA